MSQSPWVVDVAEENFADAVLARSSEVPVLVDFWAAWCGPCRILGPVLERVADDLGGAVIVAKLDTEANQRLAMEHQIRGIPACKLFIDGQVVDEFVGALPEPAVREFLARHVKSEGDRAIELAAAERRAGNLEAAWAALAPLLESPTPAVSLEAARIALARGNSDQARQHAGAVSMAADEHNIAQAILAAADLTDVCVEAGGLEATTGDDTGEVAEIYNRGACLASASRWEPALAAMLEVVKSDRTYRDDGGRKAMVALFALCPDDQLVRDYRRRLGILL